MKSLIIASLFIGSACAAEDIIEIKTPCYPTSEFVDVIVKKHGEAPILLGRSVKETNTVIWIHPKTKEYTITTTIPAANKTCVLDTGKNFGAFEQPKKTKQVQL